MEEQITISLTDSEAGMILYALTYYVENSSNISDEMYEKVVAIACKIGGAIE